MEPVPSYADRARLYAERVVNGEIPAAQPTILACRRFLSDLARDPAGWEFTFREDLANRACSFVEKLPHIKGRDWIGKCIALEDWQCFIVANVFGWVYRATNLRRFKTGYVEVPRKNAKSTLSSGIGLYAFACDDEPGAEVYSAATTREQARIVWDVAKQMCRRRPDMCTALGIDIRAHNLWIDDTASVFRPLAADGENLDGLNLSCAIIDELHAHRTRDVWDVLETATGSRAQPLLWAITTAGSNRAGICYEQRSYVLKILSGVVQDESYFGIIYTIDLDYPAEALEPAAAIEFLERWCDKDCGVDHASEPATVDGFLALQLQHDERCYSRKPKLNADGVIEAKRPPDDWTTEYAWRKANPNYGVSVNPEDLARKCLKAQQQTSAQNNFLTKHENVWVNADTAWMDMRAWDRCRNPALSLDDFEGRTCYIAVDLASRIDVASIVLWFPPEKGGKHAVFHVGFVPEQAVEDSPNAQYAGWAMDGYLVATDGVMTDQEVVKDYILGACRRFKVLAVAFDPFQAHKLMQECLAEHVPVIEYGQTVKNMSEPMKDVEGLVLAGKIEVPDDPCFTWMASNVVCHTDAKDNVYPRKELPQNKIDGPVAMIMARGLALKDESQESIYETEGLMVL